MRFDCAEPLASCGITTSLNHHLCRECETSGEQLPSCVFRAKIDICAHRLQQHPSGLSRSQQAAERIIFPAELNFNFSTSSTANASHHREQRIAARCSLVIEPWEPLLHGVRHGGGQGGHAPPPKNGLGGAVMHLAPPPIFWENSVMKHN